MPLVVTSTYGTPGAVAAMRVQVRDAETGVVLQARTNTGIREDVAATGFYVWQASLADAAGYECTWDAGGAVFDAATVAAEIVGTGGVTTIITPVPAIVPSAGASAAPGTFYIKRHDTREPLIYQALEGAQPVNITGATIKAIMRVAPDDVAGVKFAKTAHILPGSDPANGWMLYQWDEALPHTDTASDGTFFLEFEVVFPDGRKKTFPTTADANNEYIRIVVVKDLDGA